MTKLADASINNLRNSEADFLPSSETTITVPASLLQDLLGAVQDLKDEVSSLTDRVGSTETENAALRLKLASLESLQEQDTTRILLDVATDRRRLAALEHPTEEPAPAPSRKTTSHIDELHRLMTEEKSQQVSIAKGARLLGICKERLRQLKPLIMQDKRFEMGWSTVKGKKAAVIRIRRFL